MKLTMKQQTRLSELEALKGKAIRSAKRQRNRERHYGINAVRVRYTYWEQVERDCNREIKSIIDAAKA